MTQKLLTILLTILLCSTGCLGGDQDLGAKRAKSYDDDLGQQMGFAFLCAGMGAAAGAAIWYFKTVKELNDIEDDYETYRFTDLESAREWLENKKKAKEDEAKREFGTWVLGGAIVGSVLGILLYPESDSYGLINFSVERKSEIRIPLPNYNVRNKSISILLIKYDFR